MPAPNADPHGGIEDFIKQKVNGNSLEKSPNENEMV